MEMEMESANPVVSFNSTLSLYIPVVDESISEANISEVFMREQLGRVSRVDFIYNKLGKKQAFVHVACWNNTEACRELQKQILHPARRARLVYDKTKSKFWPLLPNRNPLETPRSEIISVLQDKIATLERKLNEVNFMGNQADYAGPAKRPRSENSHDNIVINTTGKADKRSE